MNITVYGRPTFKFTITRSILEALIFCSEHHYDTRCRAASLKAVVEMHQVNGFLTVWKFQMDCDCDGVRCEEQEIGGVTWQQMDTMCKIVEGRVGLVSDEMGAELGELAKDIWRTMDLANKSSGKWVAEYTRESKIA
jgi:hypothetical protein